MPEISPSQRAIRFGAFEFDLLSGELRKQGLRIKLQGQPAQILGMLLERPGEVVTREELREKLWPADTFVDFEHSVNAAVKRLRRALNDSADKPRYVETVARRGYRFIAPIEARGERDSGAREDSVRSVAVLPFQNTSADPEVEYLADGITETIISSLSRLPEVRVMARSTVFRYKARQADPRALGRRLDVDAVLIGRVLQRGEGLMIGTELVQVRNGWQIWGEQYNRTLSDLLRVQDEISREISETLSVRL
jgi:TolB-like protein